MMVWLPSLSVSFSFFTSFCRAASESGVVLLSALATLLWGGNSHYHGAFRTYGLNTGAGSLDAASGFNRVDGSLAYYIWM